MKNDSRIKQINTTIDKKGIVMYFMSRDHRVSDNHALLYAQKKALEFEQPLLAVSPIAIDYPGAPERQLDFLIAGLLEVDKELSKHNISFYVTFDNSFGNLVSLLSQIKPGLIVVDFNPLKASRIWKREIAQRVDCPVYEVDTHNIVPVWAASDKQEYAAYTIRPKINKQLNRFLKPAGSLSKHPHSKKELRLPPNWVKADSLKRKNHNFNFVPGEKAALESLNNFLINKLSSYDENRNNPNLDNQSNLSMYFHFGQLAPLRAALEAQRYDSEIKSQEAFLEELIIRRELSDNFCYYNDKYDSFDGFPHWAQKTLNEHRGDQRNYIYSLEQLENSLTHDELWNAAQFEMVNTGKMHGYMRMYWAKKILEWSVTPEEALKHAIRLNDKFQLDGNDPNGYAGVAWSIGGVHDRAWNERNIFGKIRYMSFEGCKRKFRIADYIDRHKKEVSMN